MLVEGPRLTLYADRSCDTQGISGLAKLTEQFTGCELPKNRKVTMSNWAAPHLSAAQLACASLVGRAPHPL